VSAAAGRALAAAVALALAAACAHASSESTVRSGRTTTSIAAGRNAEVR
jgi:hypothetical protein